MTPKKTTATFKQINYIESLSTDCLLTTRIQRNDWISARVGREIKFLDELSLTEASKIIDQLRQLKKTYWKEVDEDA